MADMIVMSYNILCAELMEAAMRAPAGVMHALDPVQPHALLRTVEECYAVERAALLARVERLEAVAEAARALLPAVTVYGGGPGRATIPICDVCMTERGHDAGCPAAALAAALAAVEPAG